MKQLITLFAVFAVSFSFSQTKEQDSLTLLLAFQKSDSIKIDTSVNLIKLLYKNADYQKVLDYISATEALSHQLNYKKATAEIAYYKGLVFEKQNKPQQAMAAFRKSKLLFLNLNDVLNSARVSNAIGLLELANNNINNALPLILEAIPELEKVNAYDPLRVSYKNLANYYTRVNDRENAIKFNLKRLEIERFLNDKMGVFESQKQLAKLYSEEKETRKAIDYYERILEALPSANDSLRGDILPLLSSEYLQFKDYTKATNYLLEALKLNRNNNNQEGLLHTLTNLGWLNLDQNRTVRAKAQLIEANRIATFTENQQALLKNYKLLIRLDSLTENFEAAFGWQKAYYELQHKIEANQKQAPVQSKPSTTITPALVETVTPVVETEIMAHQAFEFSENERKLNNLKLVFYALLAVFAVVLVFFILIYLQRNSRIKYTRELENKNLKIELQNAAILEQTKHLEAVNKIKDRLFSIVSHDLKDSLTSIKGFIDLLNDGSLTESEFKSLLPELSENADNATLLLFNLLNWSKSQMQSLEAKPSLFDIQLVIDEKLQLLEHKFKKKELTVRNQSSRDFVYADRSMVEIVIQNILTNAIKFSKPGDTITIANHANNARSTISISDTGIGISPENLDELFKNSHYTTIGTHNEKGTGLGLNICKELVDLNKGKIWVESTLHKGSTFFVELPKNKPE
ncbi:ATP-binding protein [Bizionia sediminis]|uniref:histidine kinase n=1 Tax=Bizionia sediminis TaxID=1737064 RepID=A0ABW5KNG6_9FLAO